MSFLVAYHTDLGNRKKTNQDALLMKSVRTRKGRIGLFVVCDGMGGLSDGELASATVIRSLARWFEENVQTTVENEKEEELYNQLEQTLHEVNGKIDMYGTSLNKKLGTTVTALLVVYSTYYIFQVGDSRAYNITRDSLTKVTEDQTLVAREVKRGNLTEEQAKLDPRKNVLLQCIGASKEIEVVVTKGECKDASLFLLCTDGFYRKLHEEEMIHHLNPEQLNSTKAMEEKAKELVEMVKQRNEQDNITVLLTKVS
ncbi:serine/threonine-protein phosphatase [Bacillus sp. BGMRC 2118]|nr:serine/threonine-protein phosphatase [Bacillus sp. BGMRC 2118]